ncbi:MAG: hypothetical protein Q8J74_08780 [Candidatus Didemnitutus sp.]|nr:hypothetical protein [Candidatus Didemnitutus sp.]
MRPTFRERYCQHHRLVASDFEQHVFHRTLYRHAWPFLWLLDLIPDYFTTDHDFIRSVGDLRSRRDFHAEAAEFQMNYGNRGFLHRRLRLRVSCAKVHRQLVECWSDGDSGPPQMPVD